MSDETQANSAGERKTISEADQLLRLLEIQAANRRPRGQGILPAGSSFRWVSLVVIVFFALVAVVAMEWMASHLRDEMPARQPRQAQPGE